MKISERGIDLIKSFEGCRLTAYKAVPAEPYYTIGYGHCGSDVRAGQTISQEMADEMLKDDIINFETLVNIWDNKYHFNQNEYDALVSFCYNVGSIGQLTQNGTRTKEQIADAMLLYVKDVSGVKLQGLVRRRQAEQKLYLTPCDKEPELWESYSESTMIMTIVNDIIVGKYGNNETRKDNIYKVIQHFVNKRYK